MKENILLALYKAQIIAENTVNGGSNTSTTVPGGPNVVPATETLGKIQNPLKASGDIFQLVNNLMNALWKIGLVVATIALVWVGFNFVLARGNPEKIKSAKQWFTYIIIGVAILFGANIIVDIIRATVEPFMK